MPSLRERLLQDLSRMPMHCQHFAQRGALKRAFVSMVSVHLHTSRSTLHAREAEVGLCETRQRDYGTESTGF
jgi:hypothetical protein